MCTKAETARIVSPRGPRTAERSSGAAHRGWRPRAPNTRTRTLLTGRSGVSPRVGEDCAALRLAHIKTHQREVLLSQTIGGEHVGVHGAWMWAIRGHLCVARPRHKAWLMRRRAESCDSYVQ
jgi:hypothetical protein